jgi:hypothetical protein
VKRDKYYFYNVVMKKSLLAILLLITCKLVSAQEIMTVVPDSTGQEMFSDFLGVRLWAADYNINSINQDLTFKYTSINNGFVMSHPLDTRNITQTPNLGIGLEEDLGPHLLIHFADISIGYSSNMWNWNIGAGLGYSQALDKKRNIRLRASLELFYESIWYGLGSYSDTTGLGFVVNGNNIGQFVQGVKYVNNCFCSSLSASLMYRTKAFDIFGGVAWNYTISQSENINFYYTRVNLYEAVYTQSGAQVGSNILKLGSYMLQVGVVREFGL